MKVIDLVKALEYRHPIELLTCLFCLFGCEEMLNTTTKFLEDHAESLREHRIASHKIKHVELHPATLLSEYSNL